MATLPDEECRKIIVDDMFDLKGNPVERAKTGRWKACSFLIGYEACERMSFYGIAANLVVYLTTQLHEGTVASARNVSNWAGVIWITPLLGAFIADTYLGRFWTFTLSSLVYIVGMTCLTLAVSLPVFKPPSCSNTNCPKATGGQVGFFYLSLYVLSLGTGGTKPNISTFGADQFDESDPKERIQKISFFNWWMFSICFGALLAQTVLVYIQDNVGWTWGYGIPTVGLIISACIFLTGTPFYRHKRPDGSPLSRIAQVIVAAVRKWDVQVPRDDSLLHELDPKEYVVTRKIRLLHTRRFRFLDKAATKESSDQELPKPAAESPWRLCTVTQVEETKLVLGMMPIWFGTLLFTSIMANVNTFFIKQGSTMNRHIGPSFQIPAASLGCFVTLSMLLLVPLYDKLLVPFLRRFTGIDRGITLLQRMGLGLFIAIPVMIIAALVETHRLKVAKDHNLLDRPHDVIPTTIFWLLPQYLLIGVADTFINIATLEFFYDQAPSSMKSIGTAIYTTNIGAGNFVSSLLITIIHKTTSRDGKQSWLVDNLNRCRLDLYYWLLTGLVTINALVFVMLAKHYTYKFSDNESVHTLPKSVEITQLKNGEANDSRPISNGKV